MTLPYDPRLYIERITSSKIYKKYAPYFPFAPNVLAVLLLSAATLYTAKEANYQQTINSDNIIYPYLFQHFRRNDIILPGHHGNILDFPLYILQTLLPYTYMTFSFVTIGLVVVTVALWVYLLICIFGRIYTAVICAVLAAFLFGSPGFIGSLIGNTIRNIEYPLGLAFVLAINRILRGTRISQRLWAGLIIIFVLFSIALAGDSLLLYCFCLPLLAAVGIYWLQSRKITIAMVQASVGVVVSVLLAEIISSLVDKAGIVSYYYDSNFSAHTVPVSQLSFSVTTALQQALSLHGAYIFGLPQISVSQLLIFLNFALLIVAVAGFYLVLRRVIPIWRFKNIYEDNNYVLMVLAISFFLTFAVYILSDQVVHALPGGGLAVSGQQRYISILPLLSVAGVVTVLQTYYARHRALRMALPIVILLVSLLAVPYIRTSQNAGDAYTSSDRNTINQIIATAHQNDVSVLLTGYWYGATSQFWSHDTVLTASVAGPSCNAAQPPFNTRKSWYTPSPSVHRSALVVDRSGPDESYWGACSDAELKTIYGTPSKIVYLNGINQSGITQQGSVEFWVYNYDVRSRVSISPLGS